MSDTQFLISGATIILIDLLLAGDNALVIAMAVRGLPPHQRRIGSIAGAGLAVLLRILLTIAAAAFLQFSFVKLAGGLLILWIALKVLIDVDDPPDAAPSAGSLWKAIWYVMLADITMSLDNILAIAGAANGHTGLIIFGLALSIPFVVFSSGLLSKLMDKYPITIYIGAAILVRVGVEMALTDPFVERTLHPTAVARYIAEAASIVVVLGASRWICKRRGHHHAR
jgi:YjbE family integral membrane protein